MRLPAVRLLLREVMIWNGVNSWIRGKDANTSVTNAEVNG